MKKSKRLNGIFALALLALLLCGCTESDPGNGTFPNGQFPSVGGTGYPGFPVAGMGAGGASASYPGFPVAGTGTGGTTGSAGTSPTYTEPVAGNGSAASGVAGTYTPPPAGSGGINPAGSGGINPAGSGGIGPAGSGAVGAAGTGSTVPGNNFIRGPDPTAQSGSQAGPYNVQSTTTGMRDPPEYGTQTLWYPTDAEPPFAAIAIVPGFVSPESSIANWGSFLASHGIVVLTIGTNSGGDSPEIRSTALLAALETIKAEHVRPGSPIEGKIDATRLAVGGWSMGGGGTLLTITAHPELKAGLAICPWYTNARAFAANQVPVIMFAGTADVLAGGMSQGFYDAIPASTSKMLFEIAGADHFYANDPLFPNVQVGLYGLSWLKVFLEGDDRYRQFLLSPPQNASDFRTTVQ